MVSWVTGARYPSVIAYFKPSALPAIAQFFTGAAGAKIVTADFGTGRLVHRVDPPIAELCEFSQQQDCLWNIGGGYVKAIIDVGRRLEVDIFTDIDEANKWHNDSLGPIIGGKRVPVRGAEFDLSPEPARPCPNHIVRWFAIIDPECPAEVAHTFGFEAAQTLLDSGAH
jgi:hypothetical protein